MYMKAFTTIAMTTMLVLGFSQVTALAAPPCSACNANFQQDLAHCDTLSGAQRTYCIDQAVAEWERCSDYCTGF